MNPPVFMSGWRFRLLLLSAVLAAMGYVAVSLIGGWTDVFSSVIKIGLPVILVALFLSLVNYGLRFIRWNSYLVSLGYRLKFFRHLQIYLSGFALTATPGKAGEALRSVLLEPMGVRYSHSLAALLSERFSDIMAVLLLSSLFVMAHPEFYIIGIVFLFACAVFAALLQRAPQQFFRNILSVRKSRVSELLLKVLSVFEQTRLCNTPLTVSSGLILGLVAWAAEGLAFWLMLEQVGADISWYLAISIYCLSMLAGAASFMPGGLGGAEAAMAAMLTMSGVPLPVAIAVTLVIRLATLWFAVLIGLFLTLPFLKGVKSDA